MRAVNIPHDCVKWWYIDNDAVI